MLLAVLTVGALLTPNLPTANAAPPLRLTDYVTDDAGRLTGVLSLRDLIVARPETPIGEVMKRDGDLRPGDNDDAPILAPGEDAAKVHPTILDMRAKQAAQYGRETVVASLAGKRVN
jgi:hypothetical protein